MMRFRWIICGGRVSRSFSRRRTTTATPKDVMATIRASLPTTFKGLPVTWKKPNVDIQDTSEVALYSVWTTTVSGALGFCGGADALPLQPADWLKISEQHLLEFTNGVVYRDDTGELTQARETLAYYPDDVLRFLLACEWNAVGGDWFPIGRIAAKDDVLGLRMQVSKIVNTMMRIAFMVSRQYMPYKKWFGSAFQAAADFEDVGTCPAGLAPRGGLA